MWLLSIWGVRKFPKADALCYLLNRHRRMSDYIYSGILYIVALWWFNIKLSDIRKCLRSGTSLSPTQIDLFCLAYAHMCSIHRFLSADWLLSQFPPFFITERWKRMSIVILSHSNSARVFLQIVLFTSLLLRVFAFDYCWMDSGVKTSERMFSDVP